jgi:molybdopterin synthase sulfur carrier subunit
MGITVRYFAAVRERLGPQDSVALGELPPQPTMAAVLTHLQGRSPRHFEALDLDRGLRMARNQALCEPDEPVAEGDELAFFPPVTGG